MEKPLPSHWEQSKGTWGQPPLWLSCTGDSCKHQAVFPWNMWQFPGSISMAQIILLPLGVFAKKSFFPIHFPFYWLFSRFWKDSSWDGRMLSGCARTFLPADRHHNHTRGPFPHSKSWVQRLPTINAKKYLIIIFYLPTDPWQISL